MMIPTTTRGGQKLRCFMTLFLLACHSTTAAFSVGSARISQSRRMNSLSHQKLHQKLQHKSLSTAPSASRSSLFAEEDDDQQEKLRALGYSDDELQINKQNSNRRDPPPNVRVDMVDGVDAVTLTALGFGLIAMNFFVFANMGDGGIAGIVATFINTVNQ